MKYRGWILPPALRDFHEGRIWLKEHSPFPKDHIEKVIECDYFHIIEGIQKEPHLKCNRCHNQDPWQFTMFDCSKCEQSCIYCRHCLQMGRVSSCTELLIWIGPRAIRSRKHPLKWAGQFTVLQQRAAKEILESIKAKRSHLLAAVCGAKNENGTFKVKNSIQIEFLMDLW